MEKTLPSIRRGLGPVAAAGLVFPEPPFDWDQMTEFVAEAKALLRKENARAVQGREELRPAWTWKVLQESGLLLKGAALSALLVLIGLQFL